MSTLAQAFDSFMKNLELTKLEQEKVSQQQEELRGRIREQLGGVVHDAIVGSYARRTAIRPLNDVDLFLELNLQVHGTRHRERPLLLLEDVQRALRKCYPSPGPETRIQGRSVNIEFARTKIGYDVIPALRVQVPGRSNEEIYEIPDRNREIWIRTNPEAHKQHCIAANDRAGGMLNRLIKAAKHWNRTHRYANGDKPLRSFHLEVMCYEAFTARPADERRGLRDLFMALEARVGSRCPDPARLGPDLDSNLSEGERQRAKQVLHEAAQTAREAVHREEQGHDQEAWKRWRSLLGPEFPAPTR